MEGIVKILLPKITATVLESDLRVLAARYGSDVRDTVDELKKRPAVQLVFGVDATNLEQHKEFIDYSTVDVGIFNFPHPGGKTNLRGSRELLKGILESWRRVVCPEAEFHLALAVGQSGINGYRRWTEPLKDPPVFDKDSWQVIRTVALAGMEVRDVQIFDPTHFPGYRATGYRKTDKGFDNRKLAQRIVIKVFWRGEIPSTLREYKEREEKKTMNGRFHCLKEAFTRDISIVFENDHDIEENELKLFELLEKAGNCIVRWEERKCWRCKDPRSRSNRVYRLYWQTVFSPLWKEKCSELHESLKASLANEFAMQGLSMMIT